MTEDKNRPELEKDTQDVQPDEKKSGGDKKINIKRELLSWVILIAVAFVIAYVITHFVIIKAEIPTASMENTIMVDDRIVGNRLSYLFGDPQRGDIVLFYLPDDESQIYVKRVIGLPGETLEIVDGTLYIDGVMKEEDYLKEDMIGSYGPYEIPAGSYFMMGDNRNISLDARSWSIKYVTKDKIIGEAWFRYSPTLGIIK